MVDRVNRRSYDSSGRRARAAQTRTDIVRAATHLFIENGYGRTTIRQIATSAQVSVETIYRAFGNKATLLHRAWDLTIGGDDEDVSFHDRPEVRAVRDEPDLSRRLQMHAELSTRTARRIAPFLAMVQAAAGTDESAAAMLEEMAAQRLVGMTVMASEAEATGQLSVSVEECRDVMWSMSDGVLWQRLVENRGWDDERFADWLARMWVALLVEQPG